MGHVSSSAATKIAAKQSSAATMLNMYDPTRYPCSPRSSTSPQVGHAGFIRNQLSKMPAEPQLGQRRRAARQSMRGMDGLAMAKATGSRACRQRTLPNR